MTDSTKQTAKSGLTGQQWDLWERFKAAYNTIDHLIRKHPGESTGKPESFNSALSNYDRKYRLGGSNVDYLRMANGLRSVLVHEQTTPYLPVGVPTLPVVERLESIRDQMTNPPRVYPKFKKQVTTISPNDSLVAVLKIVLQKDYSQFPVYDSQHFKGLLTENGITRFLAEYVVREPPIGLIELEDHVVSKVLPAEEERPNWKFVSRNLRIDEAKVMFGEEKLLEAILITAHGKQTEKPIGIITRWDISSESA
jgi:predicted transcriptional regulator